MSRGRRMVRKEQGYSAFIPGGKPEDACPYLDELRKFDWVQGWNEAESKYNNEVVKQLVIDDEIKEAKNKWWQRAVGCAWNEDWICLVTKKKCKMEACALHHFVELGRLG